MIDLPHPSCTARRPFLLLIAAVLILLLAVTACNAPGPAACPPETYPAVELEVVDEGGEPLNGASLRYHSGDGLWQGGPESLGRRTTIDGRPGRYQLEVAKDGFEAGALTVDVPADGQEACRPVVQPVTVTLTRTPCAQPPAALTLAVDPPQDDLKVSAVLPGSGRQRLDCQETVGEACGRYAVDLAELGTVELEMDGLPAFGAMQVVDNVVAYDRPGVTYLGLEHRGLEVGKETEGAAALALRVPVRRDESNCPLADFQSLEVSYPDSEPGGELLTGPPLALHYLGSLLMTDLGNEACQATPVLTALPFSVDLPAGTNLAQVRVEVEYGQGWQAAECGFEDGRYLCTAPVPNPLLGRPFVARVTAGDEEAIGLSLPFGSMCLVFR